MSIITGLNTEHLNTVILLVGGFAIQASESVTRHLITQNLLLFQHADDTS